MMMRLRVACLGSLLLVSACGRRTQPGKPSTEPPPPAIDRSTIPPFNEPLFADGTDPIANDNGPVRRQLGSSIVLDLSTPTSNFVYPRPVNVTAVITTGGHKVACKLSGRLAVSGTASGRSVSEISFRDDGAGGDPTAGDLEYTWQLAPSTPEEARRWAGLQNISVVAETSDGQSVENQIGWEYGSPTGGGLTGRARDRLQDGSLVIEVEARFEQAGRYHLQGSLYSRNGVPVAWAQADRVFDVERAGERWLPLLFHGALLTQRHVPGPYVLHAVWLRDVSAMPARTASLLEDVHTTGPIALDQLSAAPYREPTPDGGSIVP